MTEAEQIEKITAILSVELPNVFLSKIIVLFRDSNPDNWEKENITYVFKEPQECPFYPGDGIEVYDVETNDHLFFTSAQECATHFNISPITASKLARYEGTRDKRYKFKLFRIKDVNIGPLTE